MSEPKSKKSFATTYSWIAGIFFSVVGIWEFIDQEWVNGAFYLSLAITLFFSELQVRKPDDESPIMPMDPWKKMMGYIFFAITIVLFFIMLAQRLI